MARLMLFRVQKNVTSVQNKIIGETAYMVRPNVIGYAGPCTMDSN